MKTLLPTLHSASTRPMPAMSLFLRRSLWLCLGLALSFSLTACKKKGGDGGAGTAGGEPAPEQPKEEPPVELKVNWHVGKRLIVRTEELVEMEVSNPAIPTPVKNDLLLSQDMSIAVVKDREGGGRELEVEVLGYRFESKSGGRLVQGFDTKSDPKSDVNKSATAPFRKLVGTKLKYLTDPAGKVDRVEGAAELLTKMVSGAPVATQLALRTTYNEENLKKMLPGASGLPAQPVKVGETWLFTTTRPLPPFGILLIEITNTFKGMEDHAGRKCAAFEQAGGVTVTNRVAAGGTPATLDEVTLTGKTWFDTTLGTVVESTTEMAFIYRGAATTPVKIKSVTKLLQVADLAGGATQVIPGSDTKLAAPPASATAPAAVGAEGIPKAPVMNRDSAAPARK